MSARPGDSRSGPLAPLRVTASDPVQVARSGISTGEGPTPAASSVMVHTAPFRPAGRRRGRLPIPASPSRTTRADHRSDPPATTGPPGLSRAGTSSSATSCRATSTTTRSRSRVPCLPPFQRRQRRGRVLRRRRLREFQGLRYRQGSTHRTPAGTRTGPWPGAAENSLGAERFMVGWSWTTTSKPFRAG